MAATSQMC